MVMAMKMGLFMAGWLLAWASPASAQLDQRQLVDLTYPCDERTVYWPTNKPFQWEKTDWGLTAGGNGYASADFATSEHAVPDLDARSHCGKGPRLGDAL